MVNFRTKTTGSDVNALQVALECVHELGITDSSLERDYFLRRGSLIKIRHGDDLPRSGDYYLKELIHALVDEQRRAMRKGRRDDVERITRLIYRIAVISAGFEPLE